VQSMRLAGEPAAQAAAADDGRMGARTSGAHRAGLRRADQCRAVAAGRPEAVRLRHARRRSSRHAELADAGNGRMSLRIGALLALCWSAAVPAGYATFTWQLRAEGSST